MDEHERKALTKLQNAGYRASEKKIDLFKQELGWVMTKIEAE